MARSRTVVLTGGGTAGHVLPALAIAEALVAAGVSRATIEFIGARRGMETRLVPAAGFRLVAYPGRGIERHLSLRALAAALGLLVAVGRATLRFSYRRPRAVCTVGGYASVAASLAAVIWRVPLVVVSLDAVPGAANRLVARFARASAAAFASPALPHAIVTGAPLRAAVRTAGASTASRASRRLALELDPQRLLVVVAGGSLGALRLNEAALALAAHWSQRSDLCLYQVAGARDLEEMQRRAPEVANLDYRLVGYEEHLPELLAVCDVALCRAGASTVAEIAALGVPSVLVPLPGAPGDHQRQNAAPLEEAGATILVADTDARPETLIPLLEGLLDDAPRRAAMADAARHLGRLDAAEAIAALLLDVAA